MRSLGDILADCRAVFAQMSEVERAANAEALVGKNAMSGFLAVMNAAPEDIEKLNSAINNCENTAERMAETMQDNLAGQLTILKSQLEELAISIGEILMPSIRQIVGVDPRACGLAERAERGDEEGHCHGGSGGCGPGAGADCDR